MKLQRPDDLVEVELSIEPDTLILIVEPNQWNNSLAAAYARGVLIIELVEDARGRQHLARAFLNPDPIVDEEDEAEAGTLEKDREAHRKEKAKNAAAEVKEAKAAAKAEAKARPKAETTEE